MIEDLLKAACGIQSGPQVPQSPKGSDWDIDKASMPFQGVSGQVQDINDTYVKLGDRVNILVKQSWMSDTAWGEGWYTCDSWYVLKVDQDLGVVYLDIDMTGDIDDAKPVQGIEVELEYDDDEGETDDEW